MGGGNDGIELLSTDELSADNIGGLIERTAQTQPNGTVVRGQF